MSHKEVKKLLRHTNHLLNAKQITHRQGHITCSQMQFFIVLCYNMFRERILGAESTDSVSSNKQQKRVIKPRQEPNQMPDDVVRHPKLAVVCM